MDEELQAPGLDAARAVGVEVQARPLGDVRSLPEAAAALGLEAHDVVKTLVVRRTEGEHLLVLVPGDRRFSWPKLRALLGENRLTMPDAAGALEVTGYERGTITPFGTRTRLPLVVDAGLRGRTVSLGSGRRGVALLVKADAVIAAFEARVADVTAD